ncbi:MAG: alkaline phosphatase [Candidatus Coatesbacteria bacterium 4484_99]|uniref:Alkaline phosphatase n=1 Tax=Candidatus Coatesbacteria bacterium 4484_99 TaxID=1970774 RepID=A0A1W9S2U3_9BACT|nr:MAG: alkaline phosphatase [Candidatus Coatesbacteria bacterium 4484_99]
MYEFIEGLIAPIVCWIINVISSLGYSGIVVLMTIESACIPLPSEIIMPFSGYLVHTGRFNLHLASISGAVGCAIGSVIAYVVGYFGGRPLIERYGRYILIRKHEMDRADRFFERFGSIAVFIARLLPIVRTFISLPAGISRMPFAKFLLYSFVGSIPWCYALVYAGRVLGENWLSIREILHDFDILIAILIVIGIVLFIIYRLRTRGRGDVQKNIPTSI